MNLKILTFCAITMTFFFQPQSQAAEKKKPKNKLYKFLTSPYSEMSVAYVTWQENVPVSTSGADSSLNTRFDGLRLSYAKNKPLKAYRWVKTYGVNLDIGGFKGSTPPPVTDLIKNQKWLMAGAFYGLKYRTSLKSYVQFKAPVAYRHLFWATDDSLETREDDFSIGLLWGLGYRLNTHNTINFSLEHQFLWDASIWSLMYSIELR